MLQLVKLLPADAALTALLLVLLLALLRSRQIIKD